MKKIIEISGKPYEFEATATTDYMAEAVFGIRLTYALKNTKEEEFPDLVKKIAFIMNKRAELGSWRKVNELTKEDFYDWLDNIDSYALESEEVAKQILIIYANNKDTKVQPKNATSPHPEH